MNILDYMEIVVIDKEGMHKMKTEKDIENYLEGDSDE